MDLSKQILEYLKVKIPDFATTKNKKGNVMFTCPNVGNHALKRGLPSATFVVNGCTKVYCYQCGWKGTPMEVVRHLESAKLNDTDAEIIDYLLNSLSIDSFPELNKYKELNWSLIPIARNGKNPIEANWTNITHYDKVQWIKWLNNGLNIGVRTGEVSGITVIDLDSIKKELAPSKSESRRNLEFTLGTSDTIVQTTRSGGKHYIFKYDKELAQSTNIGGLFIDIRNDGGQIVVSPSKIDGMEYSFDVLNKEIKLMPESLKKELLSLYKSTDNTQEEIVLKEMEQLEQVPTSESIKTLSDGDGRNSLITSLGGILSKKYDLNITADVMQLVNVTFFNPPLPKKELLNSLKSLTRYKGNEELHHEQLIFDYCKEMQKDITARDVMESLQLPRSVVDKYLSKLRKENLLIRLGRGRYDFKQQISWTKEAPGIIKEYPYTIKYFQDAETFQNGDILMLGGQTNVGKTTVALNMLKHMIDQGLEPYYLYLESGSRFQKTSDILGITTKFFHSYCEDPLNIELQPDSFTIIDWLHIEHKEYTDAIIKRLSQEHQRKGGILVIFTQLKEDNGWFAPNLITQFPTFAARYIQNTIDKSEGRWKIDKLKEPRGNFTTYEINCKYNHETKLLEKAELIY